jgi:flagellar basal-body rod protein FlgC
MIGGIYDSLSGLAAAQKKIVTAAHNTANANTEGFKKHRVVMQEVHPQGGVEATIERVNTPGPVFPKETEAGLVQVELSNVDLGEEAVNLLLGKRLFEANLSALNTQNKALGSLLDIVE